jgi:hypothetical protein
MIRLSLRLTSHFPDASYDDVCGRAFLLQPSFSPVPRPYKRPSQERATYPPLRVVPFLRHHSSNLMRRVKICREHNLSDSVLLRWRKEHEARSEGALTEKEETVRKAYDAKDMGYRALRPRRWSAAARPERAAPSTLGCPKASPQKSRGGSSEATRHGSGWGFVTQL